MNWYKIAQLSHNKIKRRDYYKYHKDLLMGIKNEMLLNKMIIDLEEAVEYILTNSDMNQNPESVYRCPLCGDEESLLWFPGEDDGYIEVISDLEMGHWECGSCGEKIGYEDYFQQRADKKGTWVYTQQGRSLLEALNNTTQAKDYIHRHSFFEVAIQFMHGSGSMAEWLIEGGDSTINAARQGVGS